MTILAIILAAAGAFGVGAVWYMSLAEPWMAAAGITEEEVNQKDPTPFIIAGVASLLAAIVMQHIFRGAHITGMFESLVGGAAIGAFMVAPWVILHYAFAGRPRSLWWIDGGHTVAAFAVMGLILGVFA